MTKVNFKKYPAHKHRGFIRSQLCDEIHSRFVQAARYYDNAKIIQILSENLVSTNFCHPEGPEGDEPYIHASIKVTK